MHNSLLILACFLAGLLLAWQTRLPAWLTDDRATLYALYALLFLVGMSVGSNGQTWAILRRINWKIVLVPAIVVLGTLLGTGVVAYFLPGISWQEGMAVGAGFGYYSLSGILISQMHSETLGVVALLANIMREMLTLLLTPLLVRHLGKLAPIAAGGATAMDTTLPIISRFTGSEYAIIAVFSGLVLTVLVPFLLLLLLG